MSNFSAIRTVRVLRPLRLISRNPGMRLILTSIVQSMPSIANASGVVVSFTIFFAIVGMQLFMGTFASCTDPTILTQRACHEAARRALKGGGGGDSTFDGSSQATIWTNPRYGSFDNFGDAMRVLYIMSSGDEWEDPNEEEFGEEEDEE